MKIVRFEKYDSLQYDAKSQSHLLIFIISEFAQYPEVHFGILKGLNK